jgi:hypothetical protein
MYLAVQHWQRCEAQQVQHLSAFTPLPAVVLEHS